MAVAEPPLVNLEKRVLDAFKGARDLIKRERRTYDIYGVAIVGTIDQQYSIRVKRRSDKSMSDVYADFIGPMNGISGKRTLRSSKDIERHFASRRQRVV